MGLAGSVPSAAPRRPVRSRLALLGIGVTAMPSCPSCGGVDLELLRSGNYRCMPEDKIFSASEVGAPERHDDPSPESPQPGDGAPTSYDSGLARPKGSESMPTCPSCGGHSLERLDSGSYRCLDEDKLFGAAEVEDPAATGWVRPATQPATPVLLATTLEVPGYEIVRYHGEVFGFAVRSRNYFSNLGANYNAMVGGELHGLTKLIRNSRMVAVERLRDDARRLGTNAVVGLRFDTSEFGDYATELVAYGTAITVRAKSHVKSEPTSTRQAEIA